MSTIRRQSIISSGIMYLGFAMGAANSLIFAKVLTPEQYCIPSKHDGEFTSERQMHASKVLGLEPVVFSKRSTRWAPERDRLRPANRYA